MWVAVTTIALLALLAGLALSYASRSLPADSGELVEQVNELLPQTQCTQCGYPGCRPYAQAIVDDGIAINLCPPGGDDTIRRLATFCMHCRNACPVDAIVGAHQLMHTVIEKECTGCELCVAPCPVDCISMRSLA